MLPSDFLFTANQVVNSCVHLRAESLFGQDYHSNTTCGKSDDIDNFQWIGNNSLRLCYRMNGTRIFETIVKTAGDGATFRINDPQDDEPAWIAYHSNGRIHRVGHYRAGTLTPNSYGIVHITYDSLGHLIDCGVSDKRGVFSVASKKDAEAKILEIRSQKADKLVGGHYNDEIVALRATITQNFEKNTKKGLRFN